VHYSTTYEYAVHNKCGFFIGGQLVLPPGTTPREATLAAMRKCAFVADDLGVELDPFNARIAVRRLYRKTKTKTKTKNKSNEK
jgi:hypothetical protein